MDFDKHPTLKEFATTFNSYLEMVGCMNNEEGYIASHKIVGDIRIYDVDENSDESYEIVGLEMGLLGGCGCEADIIIKIKKV
jgi:hypothetical protein|nr:MAG: hypothetical protein [Caudoviricetes sp.]